jgi:hypothetical protein
VLISLERQRVTPDRQKLSAIPLAAQYGGDTHEYTAGSYHPIADAHHF